MGEMKIPRLQKLIWLKITYWQKNKIRLARLCTPITITDKIHALRLSDYEQFVLHFSRFRNTGLSDYRTFSFELDDLFSYWRTFGLNNLRTLRTFGIRGGTI